MILTSAADGPSGLCLPSVTVSEKSRPRETQSHLAYSLFYFFCWTKHRDLLSVSFINLGLRVVRKGNRAFKYSLPEPVLTPVHISCITASGTVVFTGKATDITFKQFPLFAGSWTIIFLTSALYCSLTTNHQLPYHSCHYT